MNACINSLTMWENDIQSNLKKRVFFTSSMTLINIFAESFNSIDGAKSTTSSEVRDSTNEATDQSDAADASGSVSEAPEGEVNNCIGLRDSLRSATSSYHSAYSTRHFILKVFSSNLGANSSFAASGCDTHSCQSILCHLGGQKKIENYCCLVFIF